MKDLLRFRLSGVIFGKTESTQRPIPSEKEEAMRKSTKFVALDIHKDSITVALAGEGPQGATLYGTIPSTGVALSKLAAKLAGPETNSRSARKRTAHLPMILARELRVYGKEAPFPHREYLKNSIRWSPYDALPLTVEPLRSGPCPNFNPRVGYPGKISTTRPTSFEKEECADAPSHLTT